LRVLRACGYRTANRRERSLLSLRFRLPSNTNLRVVPPGLHVRRDAASHLHV